MCKKPFSLCCKLSLSFLIIILLLATVPPPTQPLPPPSYKPALYRMNFFTTYCVWWDPEIDVWKRDGCQVRQNIIIAFMLMNFSIVINCLIFTRHLLHNIGHYKTHQWVSCWLFLDATVCILVFLRKQNHRGDCTVPVCESVSDNKTKQININILVNIVNNVFTQSFCHILLYPLYQWCSRMLLFFCRWDH